MPPNPKRPSLIGALRLAAAPFGTEGARELLQQRIALFARVACLLSFGFLVLANSIALALTPGATLYRAFHHVPNYLHLTASAVGFAIWLIARRGRLSLATLLGLDIAGTLVPMALYATMSKLELEYQKDRVDLLLVIIGIVVVMLRATLVPSTPRVTALVSAAGMAPTVFVAYAVGFALYPGNQFGAPVYCVLWASMAVFVATLSSRVIYGLREKAAEAERLGQYLLGDKIGEGGMGTVYRARHALLRRPTAIKLLPLDKAGAEAISRFEREVQHTSQLTHPNTVAIYDYGRTPDGVFYYAMEYLDGLDLQAMVERTGPLPPARVVHVLSQVCGSLSEAHDKGVVHRDVKPANIILCERGGIPDTVKVVDFGLAKDVRASADATLSHVDTLLGTPLYMAPEAIRSPESVDARSDLYALGAVGYFLLTGEPLFSGKSVMEVCGQHLHQTPLPPSLKMGRDYPRDLERVLLGSLSKQPDERPANALALRAELLGCELPAWTEADARAWWTEHRAGRIEAPARAPTSFTDSPTVVAVDFQARNVDGV